MLALTLALSLALSLGLLFLLLLLLPFLLLLLLFLAVVEQIEKSLLYHDCILTFVRDGVASIHLLGVIACGLLKSQMFTVAIGCASRSRSLVPFFAMSDECLLSVPRGMMVRRGKSGGDAIP